MNYLMSLFESAKTSATAMYDTVTSSVTGMYDTAKNQVMDMYGTGKRNLAKTLTHEFGQEFMEVGLEMAKKKFTGVVSETLKESSSLSMLTGLISNVPSEDNTLESQFEGLISSAKEKLNELNEGSNDPLIQSGCDVAAGMLDKLEDLGKDCFKLGEKTVKEFKKESLKAIRHIQPHLEKELTKGFVNGFLGPFFNFFSNIFKLIFAGFNPTKTADIEKVPQAAAAVDVHAEDVPDVDVDTAPRPF